MALSGIDICRPSLIDTNTWCLKNLYALGEGTDLIAVPTPTWNSLRTVWIGLASSVASTKVLVAEQGKNIVSYVYTPPTNMPDLFPSKTEDSLYLAGNALIFNPTVSNSIEANGVPYQASNVAIPIGSDMQYDMLSQYMQSKAWTFIKMNQDNSELHIYGGPRGYFPVADEVSEMLYSGNNDAKGETSLSFEMAKASFTIEYISAGANLPNDTIPTLFGTIVGNICKPINFE